MAEKPSIPKGTRDFTPQEMLRRNHIFITIRNIFERYGYMPIETPAMENLSTLIGKYGEEGDKLLFRILNSGNYLTGLGQGECNESNLAGVTRHISEKGLRYDLTVPFARYIVQHLNEITFPFKRYQIQPVWRADKPQKGRYREFYQCDVDVIGSDSLMNEVELAEIISDVFKALGIRTVTKLNNRKILAGIAEAIGAADRFSDLTVGVDKLDKIGRDKVFEELAIRGFAGSSLQLLEPILDFKGDFSENLLFLNDKLAVSPTGMIGLEEMEFIYRRLNSVGILNTCEFDLSLARGLNYYTGTIFEVKALDLEIGSICGGGRYDNLTGIFGLPGVSGVGVSFGADRIYDVLSTLGKFHEEDTALTTLLFVNFGEAEENYCLQVARLFREAGINTEVFPEPGKLKKQFRYADQKKIPFVVLAGEDEIKKGILTVKNMKTGEQISRTAEELIQLLKDVF